MNRRRPPRSSPALITALLLLIVSQTIHSQDYPDRIRGYKVHDPGLSVEPAGESKNGRVAVDFGSPEFSRVGLTGLTFSVPGKLTVFGRSGTVHFLSFYDFTVNGLPVEIRDYTKGFRFRSGEEIELDQPVEIDVGIRSAARGAVRELRDSRHEWTVTGTVFVFGRFKWSVLSFKRVVPVKVEFRIPNPFIDRKGHSEEVSSEDISAATDALFSSNAMFAATVRPPLISPIAESRNGVTSLPEMPALSALASADSSQPLNVIASHASASGTGTPTSTALLNFIESRVRITEATSKAVSTRSSTSRPEPEQ